MKKQPCMTLSTPTIQTKVDEAPILTKLSFPFHFFQTPKTKNPCPLIKRVYYIKLSHHIQESFKKLKSLPIIKIPSAGWSPVLCKKLAARVDTWAESRSVLQNLPQRASKMTVTQHLRIGSQTGFQFAVGKYNRYYFPALKVAKAPLQKWPAVAKYNSLGLSAHFFLMPVLWVQEQFLNVVKVMLQHRPQCRNHIQEQFLTSPKTDSWGLGGLPLHFQHAAPTHADSTLSAHEHARSLLAHTDALWKQRMCVHYSASSRVLSGQGWGDPWKSRGWGWASGLPIPRRQQHPAQARLPGS